MCVHFCVHMDVSEYVLKIDVSDIMVHHGRQYEYEVSNARYYYHLFVAAKETRT